MSAVASERLDVAELNQMFERQGDAARIVEWAVAQWGDEVVMSSSFGAESAVLLHMASRVAPRMKVIFVDTGYLFPETHAFMEEMRRRLDLNVWVYRTRRDPIAYLREAGEENAAFRKDVESCCAVNKNEPFDRGMKELSPKGWLRGIRRSQAETRKKVEFVEWSGRYGCYAVSPLLKMSQREMHGYLKQHGLPYHPLWEKGYFSIGCNPLSCTRPVAAGEDPRSGRWAGQGKVECGINLTNSLDSSNL